jgi:hypothetical protein
MMSSTQNNDVYPAALQDAHAQLESLYIRAYLRDAGLSQAALDLLPQAERKRIMTKASTYASTRLAACESRARMVWELHGVEC